MRLWCDQLMRSSETATVAAILESYSSPTGIAFIFVAVSDVE